MGSGNKMYDAIKEGVLNSLTNFSPDWDTLAKDAYEGFIADMKDDVLLGISSIEDEDDDDYDLDAEIMIQAYVHDDGDCPDLGNAVPLSDLLVSSVKWTSREYVDRIIRNSLAAFQAKLGD